MLLEVNGHAVYATSGGRRPGRARETVLFVHGSGQDHSIWALPARRFASHDRNVLAVDLPGHGRSGGAPLQSIEAIADWLVAVLDAAGRERAAIAGHSLGSLAALAAAARHPGRVRAIALVGTAWPMAVSPALLAAARENLPSAIDMLTRWGFHNAGAGQTPASINPLQEAGRRLLERARPGVIHTDLKACNDYAAGLEHAAAVNCPALLILGEHDRLTPPRAARQLAAALPNAETIILEGAGHAMLAERPALVLEHLTRVL
ncbi:MAG: alpha/beta hydrolase [Candidatus Krumholzibacteriia bacterium]